MKPKKSIITKVAGAAIKAVTKSAKPSLKAAQKAKPLANPKSAVKVLPRKTAPKTDLSNRGNKLSSGFKSDRAANEYIKKAESRWQGEYLTAQTGLKGPIEKGVRGPSKKKLAKEASMLKESNKKQPIKIDSQRNLKKKSK